MSILNAVISDYKSAMVSDREKARVLSYLKSRITPVGSAKAFDDEKIGEIIRVMVRENTEAYNGFVKAVETAVTVEAKNDYQKKADKLKMESDIYSGYLSLLPEKMTEDAIRVAVSEVLSGFAEKNIKIMGQVMSALSGKYGAALDKALASKIVKNALTS